ncbi:rhodanese-like domain-containing protein [Anaerobacillus sp. HL2]|nr:rhodanese-like domain-containing protein [Anaerobacillus sp. HL2]
MYRKRKSRPLINTRLYLKKIKGANVVVLDVRSDGERAGGAIPGSIHIPDSEINADPKAIAGQLPADKNATILIHCASVHEPQVLLKVAS